MCNLAYVVYNWGINKIVVKYSLLVFKNSQISVKVAFFPSDIHFSSSNIDCSFIASWKSIVSRSSHLRWSCSTAIFNPNCFPGWNLHILVSCSPFAHFIQQSTTLARLFQFQRWNAWGQIFEQNFLSEIRNWTSHICLFLGQWISCVHTLIPLIFFELFFQLHSFGGVQRSWISRIDPILAFRLSQRRWLYPLKSCSIHLRTCIVRDKLRLVYCVRQKVASIGNIIGVLRGNINQSKVGTITIGSKRNGRCLICKRIAVILMTIVWRNLLVTVRVLGPLNVIKLNSLRSWDERSVIFAIYRYVMYLLTFRLISIDFWLAFLLIFLLQLLFSSLISCTLIVGSFCHFWRNLWIFGIILIAIPILNIVILILPLTHVCSFKLFYSEKIIEILALVP